MRTQRKGKEIEETVLSFLGSTQGLMRSDNDNHMPLYVQFQHAVGSSIQTDEAEVIFAYDDGFAVPANVEALPESWRITPADPEGNAMFKIPKDACLDFQHRKLRKRRYHGNIRCRQMADPTP